MYRISARRRHLHQLSLRLLCIGGTIANPHLEYAGRLDAFFVGVLVRGPSKEKLLNLIIGTSAA